MLSKNEIKVIIKEPDKQPVVTNITNSLRKFQKIIGGYIQVIPLGYDNDANNPTAIFLLCDEDGKLKELPYNLSANGYNIVGTVIILGYNQNKGGWCDVPQELISSKIN